MEVHSLAVGELCLRDERRNAVGEMPLDGTSFLVELPTSGLRYGTELKVGRTLENYVGTNDMIGDVYVQRLKLRYFGHVRLDVKGRQHELFL